MTPVNRKAGTGERTREPPGETPGIFIVLSGFATTDLSVSFCDACQGAEPMGGNGVAFVCFPRLLALLLCVIRMSLYRSPQPNGRSVATE
jgi:hypothetical protein